jgi:hypothetical protein
MQRYWVSCVSLVPETKVKSKMVPAHYSVLVCPQSHDAVDANLSDEKFKLSAKDKAFYLSLKLPWDLPVKGARNETNLSVVYRTLLRRGAAALASAAAEADNATPSGSVSSPTDATPSRAYEAELAKLLDQLSMEKKKNAVQLKVTCA